MLDAAVLELAALLVLAGPHHPALAHGASVWWPGTRASEMAHLPGGAFEPLYAEGEGEKPTRVGSFWLDRVPVTNRRFLGFVLVQPAYRRGRISALFAEGGYLKHWESETSLGAKALPEQPVINVSWFAAKAYCEARGLRLPTELEWEYAAAASASERDARRDADFRRGILDWYARPAGVTLAEVGRSPPNWYGIHDLHGVVWEWVLDFNSMLVSSDSRSTAEADKQTFCGAGALASGDNQDYAAFMRMAFLSSLKASYSTSSLGFRCARDGSPGSS